MTKEDNNVAQGAESDSPESATSTQQLTEAEKAKVAAAKKKLEATVKASAEAEKTKPKSTSAQFESFANMHTQTPEPASSGKALTWIMLLINLAFISGATYLGYMGWQYWAEFKSEQQTQQQQLQTSLQQQLSAQLNTRTQEQSKAITEQFNRSQNVLSQQNQRIEEIYQIAQRISGANAGQWQISEALFIVRMAGRKLWLENDPMTAIKLLQQADQQLASIPDSRLLSIRQSLASDIAALEALNYTTPTQKVLQLQGLYAQADDLTIIQPGEMLMERNISEPMPETNTFWQKLNSWFKDNVFDISRVDQPVSPFISQKQQWLAREQLKYQLLVAQNALFQKQETVYITAIKQSLTILSSVFDASHSSTKSFVNKLSQLEQHEFSSPYPENLSSENALNNLINGSINIQAEPAADIPGSPATEESQL